MLFDENVINLKSYLLDYQMRTLNGEVLGYIDASYATFESICSLRPVLGDAVCESEDAFRIQLQERINISFPFQKVYQDPRKICYSPILYPDRYVKNSHFTLDLQEFSNLFGSEIGSGVSAALTIHVHMRGQFLRSIGKEVAALTIQDLISYCPKCSGNFEGIPYGTNLKYDISQVTAIKSRSDSNNPCNSDLHIEDDKIIEVILKHEEVNCIPLFWIGMHNFSSRFPKCSTASQYKKIREMTSGFTSFEEIRKRYDPPCDEMSIVTNVQRLQGREEQIKYMGELQFDVEEEPGLWKQNIYLDIQFRQANDVYQNITNTRGFTGESCWSGIGGFIGIFVGVSLMQIPVLLLRFYQYFFEKSKNISSTKKVLKIPKV